MATQWREQCYHKHKGLIINNNWHILSGAFCTILPICGEGVAANHTKQYMTHDQTQLSNQEEWFIDIKYVNPTLERSKQAFYMFFYCK